MARGTADLNALLTSSIRASTISVSSIYTSSLQTVSLVASGTADLNALLTSSIRASTISVSSINTSSLQTVSLVASGTTEVQQINEVIASTLNVSAAASLSLSWLNGAIYAVSTITSVVNLEARVNNMPSTSSRAQTLTFVLYQGTAASTMISSIFINNTATTIRWPSATRPTPTVSRTEIQTFTIFNFGASGALPNFTVIGQLNSFG